MFAKKMDVILIASLILVSVAVWATYRFFTKDTPAIAEIYYHSELVYTVRLDMGLEKTFSVPQNEHVIFHLYKDGSIQFEHSDCPDRICVRTGRIRHVGESAACLPNGLILKIVGTGDRDKDVPDLIAGS